MQTSFLSLWTQLISANYQQPIGGIWLIHSDEPLIHQWLIDSLKPYYQSQNQLIKRITITNINDWHTVLNELNALDLFGENSAIIATGNHKPDAKVLQKISQFVKDHQNGHNPNHLLWCLPKQNKQSITTKAVKFFNQHGLLIDGNLYNEDLRATLLSKKAEQLQLGFELDAWQLLLNHTQHNLLAAYQILVQLSLSWEKRNIDLAILTEVLQDHSQFDVFELSNALLTANIQKSLQILNYLKNSNISPSIVLWVISKDVRLILQIQSKKSPSELGIWKNQIGLYQKAAARTQHNQQTWIDDIYQTDKAIKGLSNQNPWQLLKRLIFSLCGYTDLAK